MPTKVSQNHITKANVLSYFQLTIRVTDVNDNAPKFELPDYQAHNVDEDIPLGTSILKVKAMDADSGKNAEIEYLVSGEFFTLKRPVVTSGLPLMVQIHMLI